MTRAPPSRVHVSRPQECLISRGFLTLSDLILGLFFGDGYHRGHLKSRGTGGNFADRCSSSASTSTGVRDRLELQITLRVWRYLKSETVLWS
ncbi:hypothetical protein PVAP13_8KG274000 [Panicum virgatum]|uniref:Uncharacterized protein n=1 Tax=Panicum virgatum TaxID=38727 RepID=A0A8T0PHR0_PANVG|nr:hypothetical protein PVAP13_8KG274000 [Panicum virgatum]